MAAPIHDSASSSPLYAFDNDIGRLCNELPVVTGAFAGELNKQKTLFDLHTPKDYSFYAQQFEQCKEHARIDIIINVAVTALEVLLKDTNHHDYPRMEVQAALSSTKETYLNPKVFEHYCYKPYYLKNEPTFWNGYGYLTPFTRETIYTWLGINKNEIETEATEYLLSDYKSPVATPQSEATPRDPILESDICDLVSQSLSKEELANPPPSVIELGQYSSSSSSSSSIFSQDFDDEKDFDPPEVVSWFWKNTFRVFSQPQKVAVNHQ